MRGYLEAGPAGRGTQAQLGRTCIRNVGAIPEQVPGLGALPRLLDPDACDSALVEALFIIY